MNKKNNRIQTSLPITGLDTSTPDNLVADGKQSTLHNARFSESAWRNVRPFAFEDVKVPSELSGIEIVYHHPAAGENTYIATRPYSDSAVSLYLIKIDDSFMTGTSFALRVPKTIKFFHFGNILIVINTVNENIANDPFYLYSNKYYFIFSDGAYKYISMPEPPSISTIDRDTSESIIQFVDNPVPNNSLPQPYMASDLPYNPTLNYSLLFDQENGLFCFPPSPPQNPEYFWGEICYFAVFQMADGSLISPSPLQIASSELSDCSISERTVTTSTNTKKRLKVAKLYFDTKNKKVYLASLETQQDYKDRINGVFNGYIDDKTCFNLAIKPYVTISIPDGINTELITHVNIYSTRINPIWDAEALTNPNLESTHTEPYLSYGYFSTEFKAFYADNKLPSQPFYLVKSIPIDDFDNRRKSFWITKKELDNIENSPQYEPVNIHDIFYENIMEYNQRAHISNIKTTFFNGSCIAPISSGLSSLYEVETDIRINQQIYTAAGKQAPYRIASYGNSRIISYQDYRAIKIRTLPNSRNTNIQDQYTESINLISAIENNYAYALASRNPEKVILPYAESEGMGPSIGSVDLYYVKYPKNFSSTIQTIDSTERSKNKNHINEFNKLLVSNVNNPLSFSLEYSYTIGTDTNRILAINSAAIEMSDAKFGEFPLYVFTEEGIFTLQSGNGEVLYSAVIPLNYDRIINPETLAVNYNVIYITERGIHAMFSNESTLISGPINDSNNHPLLDFLRTAHLCYQYINNEVVIYNTDEKSNRAFVLSLDNKTWSTRQFVGNKINNDAIIFPRTDDRIRIQRLNEEIAPSAHPDGSVFVKFVSRPIKLGSMEFKRLETFIARFVASGSYSTTIRLAGSVDLKTWITLREVATSADRDISIRRTPSSFRYLRATLSVIVPEDFELSGYDLEYYTRFLHRLR